VGGKKPVTGLPTEVRHERPEGAARGRHTCDRVPRPAGQGQVARATYKGVEPVTPGLLRLSGSPHTLTFRLDYPHLGLLVVTQDY
jgi:hypothetical protein